MFYIVYIFLCCFIINGLLMENISLSKSDKGISPDLDLTCDFCTSLEIQKNFKSKLIF